MRVITDGTEVHDLQLLAVLLKERGPQGVILVKNTLEITDAEWQTIILAYVRESLAFALKKGVEDMMSVQFQEDKIQFMSTPTILIFEEFAPYLRKLIALKEAGIDGNFKW